MTEATTEFKQLLREAFDSVGVGQQFTFRRTFTEGDVALFVGVTGDYNPFHIDEEFAKQTWFGRRNIPGLLAALGQFLFYCNSSFSTPEQSLA